MSAKRCQETFSVLQMPDVRFQERWYSKCYVAAKKILDSFIVEYFFTDWVGLYDLFFFTEFFYFLGWNLFAYSSVVFCFALCWIVLFRNARVKDYQAWDFVGFLYCLLSAYAVEWINSSFFSSPSIWYFFGARAAFCGK